MDEKDPASHNQAIMEFGSQFCKPSKPDCNRCIFKNKCYAFGANLVNQFPVKSKKNKSVNRYFNYLIVADKNKNIILNKRSGNDIWKGLYEFSLIESPEEINPKQLFGMQISREITGKDFNILHASGTYRHVLTHQNLFAKFYIIKLNFVHAKSKVLSKAGSLSAYAFPRLIEKFLNDCKLNELF